MRLRSVGRRGSRSGLCASRDAKGEGELLAVLRRLPRPRVASGEHAERLRRAVRARRVLGRFLRAKGEQPLLDGLGRVVDLQRATHGRGALA